MEEQSIRFKRTEKVAEIMVGLAVAFGLVIINLPISPEPNRLVIYSSAAFIVAFTLLWHKLSLPLSPVSKSFIESLVDLAVIAVVVHVTGGVRSYFNFLYLLPNLDVATTLNRRLGYGFLAVTAALLLAEAAIFYDQQSLSFAILNIWAVGLVTAYGRFLAREVESAQIAVAEAQLEKERSVNKLKDEFLFIISHELRGPITAIRGYLELLLTNGAGEVSESVKKQASSAFRQSGRLNNLIAELLDLSRLETGKIRLVEENFNLNKFLQEVIGEIKAEAIERKIKFTFAPSQKEITVYADRERVREITVKLVENALKSTGEFGQIWVGTQGGDGKAFVSVADTGTGIPQEELHHLFDKFYTPGQGKLEAGRKAGLGLFLVKSLLQKMGGEIFVRSELGKGSNFTFNLQAAKPI